MGLAFMHGSRFKQLEFNARAQRMLGPPWDTYDELRGRLHALDGKPTDLEQLPIVEALRGKRVAGAEFLAKNAAGGFIPIGASAGPIVRPDGTLLGAVVVFEDITAAKELERLLNRVELRSWPTICGSRSRAISLYAQKLVRGDQLSEAREVRPSASSPRRPRLEPDGRRSDGPVPSRSQPARAHAARRVDVTGARPRRGGARRAIKATDRLFRHSRSKATCPRSMPIRTASRRCWRTC